MTLLDLEKKNKPRRRPIPDHIRPDAPRYATRRHGQTKPHARMRVSLDDWRFADGAAQDAGMRRFAQIWGILLAALMTLTVIAVWPPGGSGPASSSVSAAVISFHSYPQYPDENGSRPAVRGNLDEDCQPASSGCCMMIHCYPGISVEPHKVAAIAVNDKTTTAAATRGLGSDPGVILPPPRGLRL